MATRRKSRCVLLSAFGVALAGSLLCCFVLPRAAGAVPQSSGGVPEARTDVRWEANRVTATGRGRLVGSGAQGRLLARRAAVTDARRNLLLLRERLLTVDPTATRRGSTVSGRVRATAIRSERTEGAFYLLELEMPLDELLRQGLGGD